MRLSAAVMAHPVREDHVTELLAGLDRDIPVSWDTAGPPSVNPQQRWATGRRAWEMHDPEADWHMVVQDDALVVPDLLSGLEKAVEQVPERTVVAPYVGTNRPYQQQVTTAVAEAVHIGASWISMRSIMWGVAIVVPVAEIAGMLDWCGQPQRATWAYDKRIGRYFDDARRWRCWYPWPSLVGHRQGPSICGHGNADRRAHRLWDRSALERDWTGPVVTDNPPGRNRSVKPPKVTMTHPRGRGARLIDPNDVPRWKGRGWQIADEPAAAEQVGPDLSGVATGEPPGTASAPAPEELAAAPAVADPDPPSEDIEVDPAAVRVWAAENGIEVSARGKVPQRVIDAYEAAHA